MEKTSLPYNLVYLERCHFVTSRNRQNQTLSFKQFKV
jgi:hypothetical protein